MNISELALVISIACAVFGWVFFLYGAHHQSRLAKRKYYKIAMFIFGIGVLDFIITIILAITTSNLLQHQVWG